MTQAGLFDSQKMLNSPQVDTTGMSSPGGPSSVAGMGTFAIGDSGAPQQGDLDLLGRIQQTAAVCTRCPLHKGRTHSVFSDGNPHAKLMIIGEGPGQNEDETGIPFVGKAGQLLTKILESVQIDRKNDVYICNVVKCRPPNNRAPEPDEMEECFPYLQGQIDIIRPRLILLAGATACKAVLRTKQGITKIRGQWFDTPYHGAKAMPIFHPSYLLRNQSTAEYSPKWHMWQDIQEVKRALDAL